MVQSAESASVDFLPSMYLENSYVSKTVLALMPKSLASHHMSLLTQPCMTLHTLGCSNKNLPTESHISCFEKAKVSIKKLWKLVLFFSLIGQLT